MSVQVAVEERGGRGGQEEQQGGVDGVVDYQVVLGPLQVHGGQAAVTAAHQEPGGAGASLHTR